MDEAKQKFVNNERKLEKKEVKLSLFSSCLLPVSSLMCHPTQIADNGGLGSGRVPPELA